MAVQLTLLPKKQRQLKKRVFYAYVSKNIVFFQGIECFADSSDRQGIGIIFINHESNEYTNVIMRLKKAALTTFLMAVFLYVILPTPDQLFIFPACTLFFAYTLHISLLYGLILISLLYYGTGAACLFSALLIGGKPVYYSLKDKYRKRKMQPYFKRLGRF